MSESNLNESLQKTVGFMFFGGIILGMIGGIFGLEVVGLVGVFSMIIAVLILIIAIVTNN